MNFVNKNVLVYGAGVSGVSAYNLLKNKGANAYIFSDKKICLDESFNILEKISDVLEIKFDYVILSPGVNIIGNKNIKKLKSTKALFLSELELGYLFCKGKFIAVTGTNGKTTCVNIINHVLSKKYKTFLCGNVGTPITSICEQTSDDCIVVCEVSSFMLEMISPNFSPDVSVILNITPDHISRHKTMDAYYKCKLNITNFQSEKNVLFIPKELEYIQTSAKKIVVEKQKFKSNLIGDFNQLNISFCYKACEIFGVSKKFFTKVLKSFTPVAFRLQTIGKKKGIIYINDSKATNPDSTVKALESMNKKVILLLGGSDKGNSFREVFVKSNKIKLALIYGQTANALETDAISMGFSDVCKFESLNETLLNLKNFTKRGDVVLFSPACASYDEFSSYVQRGEFFNKFVEDI